MATQRRSFPYAWCIALSAAVVVVLTFWIPSSPFAGALVSWSDQVGSRIGVTLQRDGGGFLAVFLPLLGALAMSLPLLTLRREGARRANGLLYAAVSVAWGLGAVVCADAVIETHVPLEAIGIALTCVFGILLAAVGLGLQRIDAPLSGARALRALLLASGIGLASFALLPLGLLGLCATLVVVAVRLARTEDSPTSREETIPL